MNVKSTVFGLQTIDKKMVDRVASSMKISTIVESAVQNVSMRSSSNQLGVFLLFQFL